jgi:hypothetical protein
LNRRAHAGLLADGIIWLPLLLQNAWLQPFARGVDKAFKTVGAAPARSQTPKLRLLLFRFYPQAV